MNCGPSFISVGPGRCGTSWLFEVLNAHPDIRMSKVKETEYFNTNFHKGSLWYESHFPFVGHTAVGEISNNYYLDDAVATRLCSYNRNVKIILSLRNPFVLLRSFYEFGMRRGLDLPPLSKFVDQPIGPVMGSGYSSRKRTGNLTVADSRTVLESIMLGERFSPFYEAFCRKQIYVFVYERLRDDPWEVLREIYEFIGVDSDYQPVVAGTKVNEAVAPRSKFVARLVSQGAYLARAVGAYRLLTWGHRSKLIKKFVYRKAENGRVRLREGTIEDELPGALCKQVREDMQKLAELDPSLKHWIDQY